MTSLKFSELSRRSWWWSKLRLMYSILLTALLLVHKISISVSSSVPAPWSNQKSYYNKTFLNSERLLAYTSRADITQCQHGKFPLLLCYITKTAIKHFPCWYTVISHSHGNWGKLKIVSKHFRVPVVVFPHNFSLFHFPLGLICMLRRVQLRINITSDV